MCTDVHSQWEPHLPILSLSLFYIAHRRGPYWPTQIDDISFWPQGYTISIRENKRNAGKVDFALPFLEVAVYRGIVMTERSGSGRWRMLGNGLGPRRSRLFAIWTCRFCVKTYFLSCLTMPKFVANRPYGTKMFILPMTRKYIGAHIITASLSNAKEKKPQNLNLSIIHAANLICIAHLRMVLLSVNILTLGCSHLVQYLQIGFAPQCLFVKKWPNWLSYNQRKRK